VCFSNFNYEVDFLPALMLLAIVGILGLERVLANRPVWRRAARWGWGLLWGFSVAFSLLANAGDYAYVYTMRGYKLAVAGRQQEAIVQYEQALRIDPEAAEAHTNLGNVLARMGKIEEAIAHHEQALRIDPDSAKAHNNLGLDLTKTGKIDEAIANYEQALRINPDYAEAHCNLGIALSLAGRTPEAIEHLQQALRIQPDYMPAKNALTRLGAGQ
jgi:tetratricopeptide (TPR) repeat protein